jgi:hypothetical protein
MSSRLQFRQSQSLQSFLSFLVQLPASSHAVFSLIIQSHDLDPARIIFTHLPASATTFSSFFSAQVLQILLFLTNFPAARGSLLQFGVIQDLSLHFVTQPGIDPNIRKKAWQVVVLASAHDFECQVALEGCGALKRLVALLKERSAIGEREKFEYISLLVMLNLADAGRGYPAMKALEIIVGPAVIKALKAPTTLPPTQQEADQILEKLL